MNYMFLFSVVSDDHIEKLGELIKKKIKNLTYHSFTNRAQVSQRWTEARFVEPQQTSFAHTVLSLMASCMRVCFLLITATLITLSLM